jgi:peroxiredoxin
MKNTILRSARPAAAFFAALLAFSVLTGCPNIPGGSNPAQEAADAFKDTHATVLGKTTDTVTAGDEAAVNAALTAYAALDADAKLLVSAQKTLLDDLKSRIDALNVDAFKNTHAAVLGKTTGTVTAANEAAVNAALTAYNALSAEAKALLGDNVKPLLDSLKSKIDTLNADAFKEDYAAVLDKPAAEITANDVDTVKEALDAYEQLSPDAKAKVDNETKDKLESLKDRVDELTADAAANDFKTTHATVLGKTVDTVTPNDAAAVNAALAAYETLNRYAQERLDTEKALLDSLKAQIASLGASDEQKAAAEAFRNGNQVLEKAVDDITTDDKDAVEAALAAYEALGETERALLAGEKTHLDELKARIDELTDGQETPDKPGKAVGLALSAPRNKELAATWTALTGAAGYEIY